MTEIIETPGLARNSDPDTSHAAAEQVKTAFLERVVLDVIAQFPDGCIASEVVAKLPGLGWETVTPRFRPLLKKGLIVDTGERRKAASGRKQRVVKVKIN